MMGITVLLEFRVKAEALDLMNSLLRELLPATRAYDGCLGLEVCSNVDQPGNLIICQQWASRERYQEYLAWRTQSGVLDRMQGLLQAPPSARYFERVDV